MSSGGLTVAVEDLSYAVRPRSWLKRYQSRIELLHHVTFLARPATLTAILGPSGCGKTTLLNVLCARARGKVTTGCISFNGHKTSALKLKGAVALLNANDRLLAYLNVRETLMFTAYLKMPSSNEAQRSARVDSILDDLALKHAQYTVVGGAWKKGLSSGEMRRCSIAMELLGDPSVLLLDEPTSGLDAVLAYEVVSVLKKLTLKGKTIICTLHQPRSSVCRLLDNVAVMAKGHMLFQGSLTEAHSHFLSTMNRDISRQGNFADDLLDIANGIEENSDTWPDDVMPASDSDSAQKEVPSITDSAFVWQKAQAAWESSELSAKLREQVKTEVESEPRDIKILRNEINPLTRYFMEIYGVAYRTFRNSWNNPMSLIMSILVQLCMGLFLGFIFYKLPHKFLPTSRPLDVSDPASAPMRLLNSPMVKILANGVDGAGTNPILDLITLGVDGKGSDPLAKFFESGDPKAFSSDYSSAVTPFRLVNMMPCAIERLQLTQTGWYTDTSNFTAYYSAWNSEVPRTNGQPNSYNEPPEGTSLDTGNYLVFGEFNPPSITQSVVKALQFFDYMFYNLPWRDVHKFCSEQHAASYIPCIGCHGEIGAFLDAASECTSIPDQPGTGLVPGLSCTDMTLDKQGDSYKPTVNVFDENGDFKRNKAGGILYPPLIPSKPLNPNDQESSSTEEGGGTDSGTGSANTASTAPRRELQISGLMGGAIDLSAFIPSTLLAVADTGKRYLEAIRECSHPVCEKIIDVVDSYSLTGSSSGEGSVLDYASVVGTVLNIAGALFFSVTLLGFGAYDGLTGLCQDRPLVNRELVNHTYKPSSFLIGRTIGDFFFHLIPAFMLVTPFYFCIDVDKGPNWIWFGKYLLVCLVVSTAAYGFSYMISAMSPSMEVAVIAAPLALVVLVCCSGFFVRDSAIPTSMNWFKYISFYRWGFFGLVINQFPVDQSYYGIPNSFTLALIGVSETSMAKCIYIMLILSACFRIIAYFGLKYLHRGIGVET